METSSESGSVSNWIVAARQGKSDAAQALWDRYFTRLVRLANSKLGAANKVGVIEDGEDAALSAFGSVFDGLNAGKFPQVEDRDDLWQLLCLITRRKAYDQIERARAQKRGGGKVLPESALKGEGDGGVGLDEFASGGPSPEIAAMVLEECRNLLAALPDDQLRDIALWKMEGYNKDEIAARLNCSSRTVSYRLELIRKTWEGAKP